MLRNEAVRSSSQRKRASCPSLSKGIVEGVRNTGARLPGRLNFIRRHLILNVELASRCLARAFNIRWHLEFWGSLCTTRIMRFLVLMAMIIIRYMGNLERARVPGILKYE